MPACKITVLKTMSNQDLADEYYQPSDSPRRCGCFTPGQEFIVEYGDQPDESFCDWAWNDIYKAYLALVSGGSFSPWMKDDGTFIACCSDGVRPVFFKLERIGE